MIWVVEDDNNIRELVVYTLNGYGFETQGFASPDQFRQAIDRQVPQLLLLDIMLPGEDGISLLKWLRANPRTATLPVVMLTAKSGEYDKVTGLDSGADDYITKPFSMMELVSRIKALLRRTTMVQPQPEEYVCGTLTLNPKSHTVTVDGQPVVLALKEYELLCLLMQNPGVVFDREQLLETIWGYSFDGENRTVDVHIRTLRQKLENGAQYIETVRGVGYRLRRGEQ